jgi:hypothetical protein
MSKHSQSINITTLRKESNKNLNKKLSFAKDGPIRAKILNELSPQNARDIPVVLFKESEQDIV